MKYTIEPFESWHVKALHVTDVLFGYTGPDFSELFNESCFRELERLDSWTLMDEEGDVVACGGLIPQWAGRYLAWMYLSWKSSRCMLRITRAAKQAISEVEGRIEMTVRADFEEGHRWARMLGFEVENPPGLMRQYGPTGEDHVGYVRIQ